MKITEITTQPLFSRVTALKILMVAAVAVAAVLTLNLTGSVVPGAALAQTSAPTLDVTEPKDGAVIKGTDVTVRFNVTGITLVKSTVPLSEAGKRPDANRPGEGHVHFMLDLQPLVVWEQNAPYTFHNLPPGEHQLMVEVVNNDHSSLAPPVIRQIHFRTEVLMPHTGTDLPMARLALLAVAASALSALIVTAGLVLRRAGRRTP